MNYILFILSLCIGCQPRTASFDHSPDNAVSDSIEIVWKVATLDSASFTFIGEDIHICHQLVIYNNTNDTLIFYPYFPYNNSFNVTLLNDTLGLMTFMVGKLVPVSAEDTNHYRVRIDSFVYPHDTMFVLAAQDMPASRCHSMDGYIQVVEHGCMTLFPPQKPLPVHLARYRQIPSGVVLRAANFRIERFKQ